MHNLVHLSYSLDEHDRHVRVELLEPWVWYWANVDIPSGSLSSNNILDVTNTASLNKHIYKNIIKCIGLFMHTVKYSSTTFHVIES